jgi:SAM-dependent methyltransferase
MLKALAKRILPRTVRVNLKRIYYFGWRHRCPVCASHVRCYLPEGYDLPSVRELDIVGGQFLPAHTCPICQSGTRARLVHVYLTDESGLFERESRVLHIAPEMGICWALSRSPWVDYRPADIEPANYEYAEGIERLDATAIECDDEVFDVVIANHVLEHIVDDRRALREIWRVLKPGGWAMLQVPITLASSTTIEDDSVQSASEREQRFGQHDHVRLYGPDYPERLGSQGFEVECYDPRERLGSEKIDAWLLNPREKVFIARKPAANRDKRDQVAGG